MKTPKAKAATPVKKVAANSKSKTLRSEAYTALLSNLEAKLAIVEPASFEIWQLSKRSEDFSNWLQAQNQLRITASLRGRLSEGEVGGAQ